MSPNDIAAIDTVVDVLEELIIDGAENVAEIRKVQDFLIQLIKSPENKEIKYEFQRVKDPSFKKDKDYVESIVYRGYIVPIYMDDYGQQFYCNFDGEEVGFGSYNTYYIDDLMYLIDKKIKKLEETADLGAYPFRGMSFKTWCDAVKQYCDLYNVYSKDQDQIEKIASRCKEDYRPGETVKSNIEIVVRSM